MNKIGLSFLENYLNNIRWGSLKVRFQNKDERIYQGTESGLNADLIINDSSLIRDIILRGELGFAEGFINNKWTTSNLSSVLKVLLKNQKENNLLLKPNFYLKILEKIKFFFKKNSIYQAKKNIEFHYDLGNDFYSKWLDKTMSYSSALYGNQELNLVDAQNKKYENIIHNLDIKNDDRICEIGTGWGGFVDTILKQNKGTNFSGYTISKNQFEYVQKKIPHKETNLDLNLLDYRKIEKKFDKIISIEMFEAVGQKYWDTYFNKIYHSLNNEGKVCLQIITINDASFNHYADNVDFIQKYIFPGGMLPSKSILLELFKKHKLELYHQKDFGHDYAKTLIEWKKRFNENWPAIKNTKFDERFNKIWNYYFDYCETGFSLNHTDVSQFYLKKVA